ncbi:regulatory protein RecX [Feifania hominis]|uniref:Regulatory protein RecX n=1 Tax=Feifania hominis TaxID=2763660 RepID=A0A926HV65_9FIRM|nr:regulatory protein RecX [Feifania hominis]MBC8537018.1 regulatory protein RecX [Feifania hominis]
MYLTKVKHLPNAVELTIDGEKAGRIDPAEYYRLNLSEEEPLDEATVEKIRELARDFTAKSKALSSLASADFSKRGLERRLRQKGIDEQKARETVDYFAERGYVSDEMFARRIVTAYSVEKHFGRRRVAQELYKRGIAREAADAALEQYALPDEENIALFFERYRSWDLSDQKMRARASNALLRYGYQFEDIRQVLRDCEEREDYIE